MRLVGFKCSSDSGGRRTRCWAKACSCILHLLESKTLWKVEELLDSYVSSACFCLWCEPPSILWPRSSSGGHDMAVHVQIYGARAEWCTVCCGLPAQIQSGNNTTEHNARLWVKWQYEQSYLTSTGSSITAAPCPQQETRLKTDFIWINNAVIMASIDSPHIYSSEESDMCSSKPVRGRDLQHNICWQWEELGLRLFWC